MKLPKINMTPGRRFAIAFWLGWAFHFAIMLFSQMVQEDGHLWILPIACAIVLAVIYGRNRERFEKEFAWMMIKNPEKKV